MFKQRGKVRCLIDDERKQEDGVRERLFVLYMGREWIAISLT